MTDARHRSIYEEALAMLSDQMGMIETVRESAGRALGIASVVLGVAGSLGSGVIHAQAKYTAVGLLLASLVIAVWVWWPRDWKCGIDVRTAIDNLTEDPVVSGEGAAPQASDQYFLERAAFLDDDFESNREQLVKLQRGVQALLVLSGAVIITVVLGGI